MAKIDRYLIPLANQKGSDLHLSAGRRPVTRVFGVLAPLPDEPELSGSDILRLLEEIMTDANMQQLLTEFDTDCAYEVNGVARFRVNAFCDMNGYSAVLRVIPNEIPTFAELNLPEILREFCRLSKGLVIITGPTGSGKTTTLAALIDYINRTRNEHIITLEDPIEFVHQPHKCIINQREVFRDTTSFARSLRAALRQDPDIVMLGEARDLETMEIAIETAETGHLVFATLHTNCAASTVERIIDKFPERRQNQVRTMLADTLKGVVAQVLCQRAEGGCIAAFEVLTVTSAVAALIRESKTHMLPSVIQTGRQLGMQTFGDELTRLAAKGIITAEEAYISAVDKADIETKFRSVGIAQDFKKRNEELIRKAIIARSTDELHEARVAAQNNPQSSDALAQLAWILATSPHEELRDGKEAVKHATRASSLMRDKDPYLLTVLGVAQAENGAFRHAIDSTNRAAKLYEKSGDVTRKQILEQRVALFRMNKPYRAE